MLLRLFQHLRNCRKKPNEPSSEQSVIVAIDAIDFRHVHVNQYDPSVVLREINKAFIGFNLEEDVPSLYKISTGKWGCGVFKGDPELKLLIQWIAASMAKRDIHFCAFGDLKFLQAQQLLDKIFESRNAGDVFSVIKEKSMHSNEGLFVLLEKLFTFGSN